jgi:hypothetical protein
MKPEPMDIDVKPYEEDYDEEVDEIDSEQYVIPNMLPQPRTSNYSVFQLFGM